MKKISVLIVLALMFAALPSAPVQAAPQLYPNELAYMDAQINVMLPMLSQFQANYMRVNGRYYQALTSHAQPPTVPDVPDNIYASPTDQLQSLAFFWNFASLPEMLAWSFSIDTYNGPSGAGYVLNVETSLEGLTWRRSINYGPEEWRTANWYQFIQD